MPDVYIGRKWNTEMPTLGKGYRVCPRCGMEVYVERIMAYEDGEYWTCPRGACGARVTTKAPAGRFGTQTVPVKIEKPDRTKEEFDRKRNNPRKYRPRNREE